MPDRPLIILPSPAIARSNWSPRGRGPHLPNRLRQGVRLAPRFLAVNNYFQRQAVLHATAAGQIPEEVIVFETVGSVGDFLEASRRIPGFDFLADWTADEIAPDADFFDVKNPAKYLANRLFLVMSDQRALQQLLGLWRRFQRNQRMASGFSAYTALFRHLRDVRLWSTADRLLETGVVEYWVEAAASRGGTMVPFEVELWFRHTAQLRAASVERVRQVVSQLHGNIVSVCEIEDICYHAVVVTLPSSEIQRLVNQQSADLLGDSSVMFFRPSGQSVSPRIVRPDLQEPRVPPTVVVPSGDPTVALLDGLPLENHVRLAGRLRVDDPDGFAAGYIASERDHGTTMASIIIHGDLNTSRPPLQRPLYIRPLMRPDPQPWNMLRDERIPFGTNPLDLTHRAIRRLFEAEGTVPPAAPSIKIINLSIGDPLQPFHIAVSPWGRLLDWLSAKYNVLFCVSAGNHTQPIVLGVARTAFAGLSPRVREAEVLKAIHSSMRHRRILAPSDSVNSITVGAWHSDFGPAHILPYRINPFITEPLPSPISGLGCGFRNSTKPDILIPGGRQFYSELLGNTHANATLEIASSTLSPGILAASPSSSPLQVNLEKHTRGTSNAAAIATRSAAFLYEQLLSLRAEPDGDRLSDEYIAVLLKGMLVHTAAWGAAYDHLRAILKPAAMREEKFRRLAARFLGFGFVEPIESLVGADHRATMLGCGELTVGSAHEYRIPLPPSLNGVRGLRRIVVTLTWLSQIHPRHRNYRGTALWFDVESNKLATSREDTEWRSARNGTVQHEVFEGENAAAFADGETMVIRVNCRADANSVEGPVRYGLAISLEVAEELRVPVYDEIAVRIRPAVAVGAAP